MEPEELEDLYVFSYNPIAERSIIPEEDRERYNIISDRLTNLDDKSQVINQLINLMVKAINLDEENPSAILMQNLDENILNDLKIRVRDRISRLHSFPLRSLSPEELENKVEDYINDLQRTQMSILQENPYNTFENSNTNRIYENSLEWRDNRMQLFKDIESRLYSERTYLRDEKSDLYTLKNVTDDTFTKEFNRADPELSKRFNTIHIPIYNKEELTKEIEKLKGLNANIMPLDHSHRKYLFGEQHEEIGKAINEAGIKNCYLGTCKGEPIGEIMKGVAPNTTFYTSEEEDYWEGYDMTKKGRAGETLDFFYPSGYKKLRKGGKVRNNEFAELYWKNIDVLNRIQPHTYQDIPSLRQVRKTLRNSPEYKNDKNAQKFIYDTYKKYYKQEKPKYRRAHWKQSSEYNKPIYFQDVVKNTDQFVKDIPNIFKTKKNNNTLKPYE